MEVVVLSFDKDIFDIFDEIRSSERFGILERNADECSEVRGNESWFWVEKVFLYCSKKVLHCKMTNENCASYADFVCLESIN